MQTKIADGQENPLALIESAKFYEVQKYLLAYQSRVGRFLAAVERQDLEDVPQDAQQVMQKHFNAAAKKQRDDIVQANAEYQKTLELKGLTFNTHAGGSLPGGACQDVFLQRRKSQIRRRSLDAAAKIRRQHRLIAMHLARKPA